jgi:hypothetical protein
MDETLPPLRNMSDIVFHLVQTSTPLMLRHETSTSPFMLDQQANIDQLTGISQFEIRLQQQLQVQIQFHL